MSSTRCSAADSEPSLDDWPELRGRKIALVGDIRRNGYDVACRLRSLGVDITVFGRENDLPFLGPDPQPEWFHTYRSKSSNPLVFLSTIRWLRDQLRGYDLVHARGGGVMFTRFLGLPFLAQAVGSDLRVGLQKSGIRHMLLRSGYSHARVLLTSQVDHLGVIPNSWGRGVYCPLLVNTDTMRPDPVSASGSSAELTIFHPAVHWWGNPDERGKGNDLLLRAFARFVHCGNSGRLILLRRGKNWEATVALVETLQISQAITVLDELDQESLRDEYLKADVVADQFGGLGMPGLCAFDAMSCGRPVICCTDMEVCEAIYGEAPPIWPAWTEEAIYQGLLALRDPSYREELGTDGRRWVVAHHSWPVVARRLLEAYHEACQPG